ncbi:MAG: bile acid:sodium symporter [Conexivisphaerales archaeon]
MNEESVTKRLGLKTLLFPMLVLVAIALGLTLGFSFKEESSGIATYGIPVGLFFMIYPAMTKVRLEDMAKSLKSMRSVGLMVMLNYAIAPFLVAGIGYLFIGSIFSHIGLLPQAISSQVLVGVILLGVAPCIAMVMVWTDLAHGNLPLAVSFVAWNSIIQIITTPLLVYVLTRTSVIINPLLILESVLFYLLLPLLTGMITRKLIQKKRYFSRVLNTLSSVQTIALLFTILVIFWGEGYGIIDTPSLVWMIAVVMLTFYFILFHLGYLFSRKLGYNYADSTAIGFTVSARDFEVSIAIALAAFSAYPYVAVTTAIGPLLEIPLMLLLVWIQLGRKERIRIGEQYRTM